MNPRVEQELALLQHHYGEVDYDSATHWFLIRRYRYACNCRPETGPIAFQISPAFPGAPPYGFAVPAELRSAGHPFSGGPPPSPPPFAGAWVFLSWQPENWRATADVLTGSNLWGWARGFATRLAEGP